MYHWPYVIILFSYSINYNTYIHIILDIIKTSKLEVLGYYDKYNSILPLQGCIKRLFSPGVKSQSTIFFNS